MNVVTVSGVTCCFDEDDPSWQYRQDPQGAWTWIIRGRALVPTPYPQPVDAAQLDGILNPSLAEMFSDHSRDVVAALT